MLEFSCAQICPPQPFIFQKPQHPTLFLKLSKQSSSFQPNPNITQEMRDKYLSTRVGSQRLGKQYARYLAQQPPLLETHEDVVVFYKSLFPNGDLPQIWQEQLGWAKDHPEIFDQFRQQDALPLDPKWRAPKVFTLVEWFQYHLKCVLKDISLYHSGGDKESLIQQALDYEIQYVLETSGGGGLRGLRARESFIERIQESRPELVPLQRPLIGNHDTVSKNASFRRCHKTQQRLLFEPEDIPRKLIRPGEFLDFNPRGWKSQSGLFYRVSWKSFKTPEEAIDYFLNRGEQSQLARNNHDQNLMRIARTLLIQRGPRVSKLSDGIDYSYCPTKCFISISQEALSFVDNGNPAQCRTTIKTDRAIPAGVCFSNCRESEFALPLILNPKEIQKIELNFTFNSLKTSIHLKWSTDYKSALITIQEPNQPERYLRAQWNASNRSYFYIA